MLALTELNLDCMTAKELTKLHSALLALPQTDYVRHLRNYAWSKNEAMTHREAGRISAAILHERMCDCIYAQLPVALRW